MVCSRTPGFVPAKVVRQVVDPGSFLPHQEYLQCREPVTWSRSPLDGEVMDFCGEADPLARQLQVAGERWAFPVTVCVA